METVHAGSPTKHPARRLATIEAAGELKIPFTSGILVGIGETQEEQVESLEALAELHEKYGHIQEVILQNFVPHPRYYGAEVADIADEAARERWEEGGGAPPLAGFFASDVEGSSVGVDGAKKRTPLRGGAPPPSLPAWASAVGVEDIKRLIAECKRLMPDVGVQVPPNLSDAWGELVEAGATDLGGLSANGDHISPEHAFPSPHEVRKESGAEGVCADGAALRLSAVHGPRVDGAGGSRRDQAEVLELHSAQWVGAAERGDDRWRAGTAGDRERARGPGAQRG